MAASHMKTKSLECLNSPLVIDPFSSCLTDNCRIFQIEIHLSTHTFPDFFFNSSFMKQFSNLAVVFLPLI